MSVLPIYRPHSVDLVCVLVEGWNSSMCLSTYSLSNETVSGQLKAVSGSLCSRIVEDVIVCPAYIPAALRRLGLCARRRLEQFYVPVDLFGLQ